MLKAMEEPTEESADGPRYRPPDEINTSELRDALRQLPLFDEDPYLVMQAFNLTIVDQFLTNLEYAVLKRLHQQEATPIPDAAFLSAQSQMWIFSAYELMRSWRQRAKDMIKWAGNGGLEIKLRVLQKELGYPHLGRQIRAKQIKRVLDNPSIVDELRKDLRRTHILFARLEAIRVAIAKHEIRGQKIQSR